MRYFFLFLTFSILHAKEPFTAFYSELTPKLFEEHVNHWEENNPVPREELRLITITHLNFQGESEHSSLIIHKTLVLEVIEIFEEIYEAGFPMEELSSFSSRTKRNKPNEFSLHSYGVAIDISPYQNPYVRDGNVLPIGSDLYLDRRCNHPGLIHEGDACYQAFTKRGWTWGGHWESLKDYMHFEKDFSSQIGGNGISWE